jgi:hypothetical protein
MECDRGVLRYRANVERCATLATLMWVFATPVGCASKSLPSANRDVVLASADVPIVTAAATTNPTAVALPVAIVDAEAPLTPATTAVAASTGPVDTRAMVSPSAVVPVGSGPRVVTIGMHVGGGPFDEATKVPFKRAVEPAFTKLRPCFELLPKPQLVNVGVDLLIPISGGRARVTRPRSSIQSAALEACVVRFFEDIEFEKPQRGPVGVSYSVKMAPR